MSYAWRRVGQQGGPDARRHLRPADRDAAGLSFLRSPQAPRYRLDAGDGFPIVRDRTFGLHTGHQDARAAHRLRTGPCRAGEISRARDEEVVGCKALIAAVRRHNSGVPGCVMGALPALTSTIAK